MNPKKRLMGPLVMAVMVTCSQAASLKPDTSSRGAEGAYEYTWLLDDFEGSSRSVCIEFANVDQYVKAGVRPPGSLSPEGLSIKSDGRQKKLHMRFSAKETQGKVGLLVDGQVHWVDLASVPNSQKNPSPVKDVKFKKENRINPNLRVVGVKVTGRPLVGETVGVDFRVLSTDKSDSLARTLITWHSGPDRILVGKGKSYLVHEEDRYQPLFALITPISKSGVPGRSTEYAMAQVIQSPEHILPVSIVPLAVIPPKRIWTVPVDSIDKGNSQALTVTMNASEYLLQRDVESLVKEAFSTGVNTQNLRELVKKIDLLYVAKKMPNFKALVPEQNFSEGNIQLTLMEPVVGNVSFSGQENEQFLELVSSRLGVRPGQLLNVGDVDEKVQIFNLRNRGKSRVLLEPGEGLGESNVHVEITPPPKAEITVNINNTGSEETGRHLRSVKGTMYGQIYGTEVIALSRADSNTLSVMAASVDVPITDHDLLVGVGRTEVSNQPIVNPIDIASKSSTTYFQLVKPWVFSSRESIDFSLRSSLVNNGTSFLGQTLKSNTSANKLMLGASYDLFSANDWSRAKFTSGVQYTNVDTRTIDLFNEVSDGSVGKVNYNVIYQMDGTYGWGGKAELNAQPLRKLMPSADKFVVGMDNVRAYKPGAAVGDAGMSLNLDIYKTTYIEVDEAGTKLLTQPYFFFDSAVVYDGSADFSSKHFKAFGYGIKIPFFAAYKGFSFDLFRAHALSNSANKPSGARLGFSLNYLY